MISPANPSGDHPMDTAWLERYSRQILLREVGGRGQHRLQQACVGIIGGNSMATPLLLYLAAAGVGHLVLADTGQAKTTCATLHALNPRIKTTAMATPRRLDRAILSLRAWDLVVLTSADPTIRQRINRAALHSGKTLLAGWQVGNVYGMTRAEAGHDPHAPCLRCAEQHCATLPSSPTHPTLTQMAAGTIGCVLAMESIRFLLDTTQGICYGALVLNPEEGRYDTVPVPKNPFCPACRSDQRG
jgi:molybdopterin/thiamine biosynthesis adenylyltransferase